MGNNIFDPNAPVLTILKSRFKAVNVPDNIKNAVLNDISKWYRKNGKEWTVERLKFLHQAIKKNAVTDDFVVPQGRDKQGKQYPWVKLSRQGRLVDHWGALMTFAAQSPRCLQEAAKLTRSYTVMTRYCETADVQKWVDMVQEPYQGKPMVKYYRLLSDNMKNIRRYIPSELKTPLKIQQEPYIYKGQMKDHHEKVYQSDLANLFCKELQDSIWSKPQLALHTSCFIGASLDFPHLESMALPYNGCVNTVDEPGMKTRYVLNFNKAMEHVLEPMTDRLYNIIRYLPWEATHDEDHGFREIQHAMKRSNQKQKMYCYDMSNATDRFPLQLQLHVLRELFSGDKIALEMVDIFEAFIRLDSRVLIERIEKQTIRVKVRKKNGKDGYCNKKIRVAETVYDGTARWHVGQPMGARPSFAMFSLTHGLICMALMKGAPYTGQFVVHGDDLVIMDDDLAIAYQQFCRDIDIKLNDFKGLESYRAAEINSKLVFQNCIVEMRKWKPIDRSNVLDHFSYWGPEVLNWLGYDEEEKFLLTDFILPIPGILPGYRGWNPHGKSLAERLSWFPNQLLEGSTRSVDYGIVSDTVVKDRLGLLAQGHPETTDKLILSSTILDCLKVLEQSIISDLGEATFTAIVNNSLKMQPSMFFANLSEITKIVRERHDKKFTLKSVPCLKQANRNISATIRPNQLLKSLKTIVTPS